jgi:hypothetical protein
MPMALSTETPGHGLSELPMPLTSLSQVPLEMVAGTSYSNNVGFYKSAFYVFGPNGNPAALQGTQAKNESEL